MNLKPKIDGATTANILTPEEMQQIIINAISIDDLPISYGKADTAFEALFHKIAKGCLKKFGIAKIRELRAHRTDTHFNGLDNIEQIVGSDKILKRIFNLTEDDLK